MVIEQLLSYVSEFFAQLGGKKVEFAYYSSGDALLNAKARADIAFLDVEMPGVSGIHVGAKLKELNPTTLIISKKPGNTGISRDIRTEFTTDLLLSD